MRLALLFPLTALAVAACDGTGTSVTIDAKSDGGNSTLATDGNGQMAIKVPGFEGALKIPKMEIDAEDFEMNGVTLYPGSKITNLHVNAEEHAGRRDKGEVTVDFTSRAAPATVQQWFREKMTAKGFKAETDGAGLKGTTDEGDPFTLRLEADGAENAKGQLRLGS